MSTVPRSGLEVCAQVPLRRSSRRSARIWSRVAGCFQLVSKLVDPSGGSLGSLGGQLVSTEVGGPIRIGFGHQPSIFQTFLVPLLGAVGGDPECQTSNAGRQQPCRLVRRPLQGNIDDLVSDLVLEMDGLFHDDPGPGKVDQPRPEPLPHRPEVGEKGRGEIQLTFRSASGPAQGCTDLRRGHIMDVTPVQFRTQSPDLRVEDPGHVRQQLRVEVSSQPGPGSQYLDPVKVGQRGPVHPCQQPHQLQTRGYLTDPRHFRLEQLPYEHMFDTTTHPRQIPYPCRRESDFFSPMSSADPNGLCN